MRTAQPSHNLALQLAIHYYINNVLLPAAASIPAEAEALNLRLLKHQCHAHTIVHNSNPHAPVSQLDPVNPAGQVQVCEFRPSIHVPPFWQGLGEQSSTSAGDGERGWLAMVADKVLADGAPCVTLESSKCKPFKVGSPPMAPGHRAAFQNETEIAEIQSPTADNVVLGVLVHAKCNETNEQDCTTPRRHARTHARTHQHTHIHPHTRQWR